MEKECEKCEMMRKGLNIIGSRWKLIIIQMLRDGTKRYGELKRLLPDISEKMLINELKSLVELGFVERHSYSEVPPRVEYTITHKGMDVFPLIDTIIEWSVKHFSEEQT